MSTILTLLFVASLVGAEAAETEAASGPVILVADAADTTRVEQRKNGEYRVWFARTLLIDDKPYRVSATFVSKEHFERAQAAAELANLTLADLDGVMLSKGTRPEGTRPELRSRDDLVSSGATVASLIAQTYGTLAGDVLLRGFVAREPETDGFIVDVHRDAL